MGVEGGSRFDIQASLHFAAYKMPHLTAGLECIPVKIQSQSVSLIALTPLSPRCNEIDAETVLPLLGQNYFWLTAQEDVCDITLSTAGNMWRVGSDMSWFMHLNLTAKRGSIIQCGTVSGGAILEMALENVRFKDTHDLDLMLTSSHPLLVISECHQWGHYHWRWGLRLYGW